MSVQFQVAITMLQFGWCAGFCFRSISGSSVPASSVKHHDIKCAVCLFLFLDKVRRSRVI